MENLCEDVLSEILSFLPAEDLQNSRLVCRAWFAVMRSPNFCRRHFSRHSSSNSKVGVLFANCSIRLLNLEHGKLESCSWSRPRHGVLATSGGVLLVIRGDRDDYRKLSLYARNPLTRQHAELPPLPIDLSIHDDYGEILPNASIAYIPGTGEYKVVCPYVERSSPMVVCFSVLTLGRNKSWRRIYPDTTIFPDGFYLWASAQWVSVSAGGIIYFYYQEVAVDLRSENIQVVSLRILPILRLPRDPKNTEFLDLVGNNFTDYKYFKMGEQLGRIEYEDVENGSGRGEFSDVFSVAILKGFGSNNCYWSELIFDRNPVTQYFRGLYDEVAWLEDSDTLVFLSDLKKIIVTYNVKSKEIQYIDKGRSLATSLFVHNNHIARW